MRFSANFSAELSFLNSLSFKIWQFWSKSQTDESQDFEKDSTKADYTS